MKKGYWIAHITVTDPDGYPDYIAADKLAFDKFGARFPVRGGACTGPEGPIRDRHVVIEFDSYQQALQCCNSPEYQNVVTLRQRYADSEIMIVEGV